MPLSTTQYGYLIDPMVPFTDDHGQTIKDGFLKVYIAGSSTPVLTYSNYDGTLNPVVIELDNSGRCKTKVIVSKGLAYKVVVYDKDHSQENPILTVDNLFAIGASVTAGAGSTVVMGLDGFRTKPYGFVDASVIGTDGYVALDHTLVEDDLDTDAKVSAIEEDRYIPLLNEDVNDPDSKITLKRLRQWANRPTQVVIIPSDFIGTGLSNDEWAAAVAAIAGDKTAVVKWTESGASRVAFSIRYEAGVCLVFVSEYGGYVTEYIVAASPGAHAVTTNVYELAESHSITKFDVTWDLDNSDYVFPAAQDVINAVGDYIEVQLVFHSQAGENYVYALTYKSSSHYEWTREDCQLKFDLVGAGSPVTWTWTASDTSLVQDIAAISEVIPSEASSSNKLAIDADISKISGSIAPSYSSLSFPIAEGTLCMYARRLYVCIAPGGIPTSEDWTAGHWTQTRISQLLTEKEPMYKYLKTDSVTSYTLTGAAATASIQPTSKDFVLTRLDDGDGGTNYLNMNYPQKVRKAKLDMGGTGVLFARTALAGVVDLEVYVPAAFASNGVDTMIDSFKVSLETYEAFEDKTIEIPANNGGSWAPAYEAARPAALRLNGLNTTLYIADFNVQDDFVGQTLNIFLTLGLDVSKLVSSDGTTVID